MNPDDPWIGLVEVEPEPGNVSLGDAQGAFVNVFALASCERDYHALVSSVMKEHGFRIRATKDVMPFAIWRKENTPHEDLVELAQSLTEEFPIQFDEFQSFSHQEDA